MSGRRGAFRRFAALLAAAVCLAAPGAAQTDLGSQRVATSSGTFLKIGVDARGAALGGAYAALAEGSIAPFYNPAGLARLKRAEAAFSYIRWPADIDVLAASAALPIGGEGMSFGVVAQYVGTTLDETTEYHPQGTGRTFGYSDLMLGVSAARPFSDRLLIGGTFKVIREDLGSAVGGPTAQSWLVDAGSLYQIGALNGRLGIGLLHFGPDIRPDGSFDSQVQGDEVDYAAFSPPTTFRIGLCFEPLRRGPHVLTATSEVAHVSDNREIFRGGAEYQYQGRYFARAGYDGGADAAKVSAGLGLRIPWGQSQMAIDYAYTDGGPLLSIHRWSVAVPLGGIR